MVTESPRLGWKQSSWQLFKYTLIGVLTNLLGYIIYLVLTNLGGSPKITMTALYAVGVGISFFANRRFTFQHKGHLGVTGYRYLIVQLLGYLLNLFLLLFFVDWLGYSHQLIQAIAVFVVAGFLFVLFRIFVFTSHLTYTGWFAYEALLKM
jgi:putative flippase GtrA